MCLALTGIGKRVDYSIFVGIFFLKEKHLNGYNGGNSNKTND
ncbi:hypothetical protein IV71_GL000258 [Fructobacillus fructosus KCTC 3544]|nr:hypothetical protein IV71_GL000258 [Fructobacillus fructosus KCTC 3544]